VLLTDDPGDLQAEPNTSQVVAAGLGILGLNLGFVGQAVGRMVSASTPVRAPKALGVLSAIASVIQILLTCGVGSFFLLLEAEAEQGNGPDIALETLGGLSLLALMFVVVGGESIHGFAVGAVGKVLRADGARVMGNGLGILAALGGLLAVFVFCGLAAWVGENNPQNPEPNPEQTTAMLGWMIGSGVLLGLYWVLDLVLLQLGRSAVARIGEPTEDGDGADQRWD
jgi:hypothetical protein